VQREEEAQCSRPAPNGPHAQPGIFGLDHAAALLNSINLAQLSDEAYCAGSRRREMNARRASQGGA
jgi:hypothetical protein